jgi:hypothetical protein
MARQNIQGDAAVLRGLLAGWALAALTFLGSGCDGNANTAWLPTKGGPQPGEQHVPAPIDLLLPATLDIHPFTQTATFPAGDMGLHARVQTRDSFGDPTKAFGDFRFEMFLVLPDQPGQRGPRVAQWEVSIADPEQNLLHWDRHTRSYEFKLGGLSPGRLRTGTRLLLVATFSSRFTNRITAEREIIAGD